MTTVTGSGTRSTTPSGSEPSPGPSVTALRARRLLAGGLLGAHAIALICVAVFAVLDGLPGVASAALAAALVILFYTVAKAVQVRWADAPATTLFRVSVLSYIVRVSLLTALLAAYFRFADESTELLPVPLVVTAVGTVVGWLAGEIIMFSRLRIPNFDEPSDDADSEGNTK
jgi:hypothetical protein